MTGLKVEEVNVHVQGVNTTAVESKEDVKEETKQEENVDAQEENNEN